MFSVSSVRITTTITKATTKAQVVVDKRKNHLKRSFNVMQHSPAVVFMCVQHSQQQVPMLNNFMCMRMRGWHHNSYSNNYLSIKGTTSTKTLLKRSKGLRKKRDIIFRRNICCRCLRFWAKQPKHNIKSQQNPNSQHRTSVNKRKGILQHLRNLLATRGSNMMSGKSNPPHTAIAGRWHSN